MRAKGLEFIQDLSEERWRRTPAKGSAHCTSHRVVAGSDFALIHALQRISADQRQVVVNGKGDQKFRCGGENIRS